MNIGDRVKVIRNDETMRDNTADRYGYIIRFIMPLVMVGVGEPKVALVQFNDYEAVIATKHLRVKEGGAG